jgi:hypothetical protein
MAEIIYFLCALISVFCAALLIRNHARTRLRLALLASLCFAGLALNNVLLFVDSVIAPDIDLGVLRSGVAFVAMLLLVLGLALEDL